MVIRARVALRILGIALLVSVVAYAHYLVNQLTTEFTQDRITHAAFFSKLIRENWDVIKSSDAEKQALLNLLSPALLSTDIMVMRAVILILLYGCFATAVIGELLSLFKLRAGSRRPDRAP